MNGRARLSSALASGRAPAQALLEAGLIAAESGQRGRAQQILESLFENADWSRLPEQAEPAFEILVDLYQERGFHRKREALLDAVLDRGPLFLRGVAWSDCACCISTTTIWTAPGRPSCVPADLARFADPGLYRGHAAIARGS